MKFLLSVILIISIFACDLSKEKETKKATSYALIIENENYILKKPQSDLLGTLILFGGYPESPEIVMEEFEIDSLANKNNIAVLHVKFNRRLWLEENEKLGLTSMLEEAFGLHKLPSDNVFLGGFSSGGNIALLLSNYLIEEKSKVQPEGIFVVDSPVNLRTLYKWFKLDAEQKSNTELVQQSLSILSIFEKKFGDDQGGTRSYETESPFNYATRSINNLRSLKNVKIRLYTEPDTVWWKNNFDKDYDEINAFYIKELSIELEKQFKSRRVELIETKNKGFRKNGDRHPHSWSIINKQELLQWMIGE